MCGVTVWCNCFTVSQFLKFFFHCFIFSILILSLCNLQCSRLRLKCDDTLPETRIRLLAKRTNPFKSTAASVQSTSGRRGVRISGSNPGYTIFRGCVKSTGYPLHSPVSPSLPLPCVTVCHHISTALYHTFPHSSAPLNCTLY